MQHLQQQPHPRIHLDLFQQSRSRHAIILSLQRHGLDFEIAEQPHQHAYEFHLCEFPPRTAARTTGPADKGTVACGRLLQVLHGMCGWALGLRNGWWTRRGDPSRWLEFNGIITPIAGMRVQCGIIWDDDCVFGDHDGGGAEFQ